MNDIDKAREAVEYSTEQHKLEAIARAMIALYDLFEAELKTRDNYRWNREEPELPPGSRDNL